MTNQIEIAVAKFFKPMLTKANSYNKNVRANPLALKAAIELMAKAETAKENAAKDKNKVFYAAMNNGGLGVFFDNAGKQQRALAMELSGLRKCAKEELHKLDDDAFSKAIEQHEKDISSIRQFATDYFKKPSEPKGNDDGGDNPANDGNDEELLNTPKEQSLADQYRDFINRAFAGNPKSFWVWIEKGNNEEIESDMINTLRKVKAQPEVPTLQSIAS
jgi:hypothetical protein